MRAVTLDSFDAAPAVREDLPAPTAAPDGLVVRVRASSVNPVDNAIAAGMLRGHRRTRGRRRACALRGETILIVGATGGVGSFAVQLAARAVATIIAPTRAEDADYLRKLGVTEHLARDGDVVAAVRDRHPDGVDSLLDLVSYAPGAFDGVLRDGARVASSNGAAGEGPRAEPT